MLCVNRASDLYEFEGKESVNIRGSDEALVVIAGGAEVDVVGIGHVVAAVAGAGGIGTIIAC